MFSNRHLFFCIFLVHGIIFLADYGLNLKYRKQIYREVVAVNKFEGEWIDPNSLGIVNGNFEFENVMTDSDALYSEEVSIKEAFKSPKSFSNHRIPSENILPDGVSDFFATESNTIFSQAKLLVTISSLIVFFGIVLSLVFSKTVIFSFFFVLNLLWQWMKLYQEKIAEKQNLTENLRHPNECTRGNLHWYEEIYLYLSSFVSSQTDCREYYKARLVDSFWEVSLPVALMNAVTTTICEPLKVFAQTLRICLSILFRGLTLVELSIALFSIIILLLMLNRYSFSLFWGAITLYQPGNSLNPSASPSLSFFGSIKKYFTDFFQRNSTPINSQSLPDNQKVVTNKDIKAPSRLNTPSNKIDNSDKFDIKTPSIFQTRLAILDNLVKSNKVVAKALPIPSSRLNTLSNNEVVSNKLDSKASSTQPSIRKLFLANSTQRLHQLNPQY